MNPFASYNAINAKLHGRRKALLKTDEWEKLLEFKSVTQMIEFLKKQYGYEDVISEIKLEDMHRTKLEVQLDRYVVLEIEKILYYFAGSYHAFFKALLLQYEISDLQLILRAIAREEDRDEIKEHFVHSEKYTELSYEKLLASRNVAQFVEALKGSSYYDMLKTMTQEDVVKREFHMEMKLNMLFYKNLIDLANKLSPKDFDIAKRIIGTQIDYSNVQWIYRATKYYDISKEEILIYSLTGGNKITYPKLKRLCYCRTLEEFKRLADKYLIIPIFEQEEDAFLQRTIGSKIYMLMSKGKDTQSIQPPLKYIYELMTQLKDLIAITEGIRYDVPREQIKKYLVHTL